MLDLLAGPLVSTFVGAIGGIVTQVISYKTHALDLENEEKKRAHELEKSKLDHARAVEMTRIEQDGAIRKISLEGDIAAATKDLDNLGEAIRTLPKWSGIQVEDSPKLRWFKAIIESLQIMVRVVATIWLTGVTTWLGYKAASGGALSESTQDMILRGQFELGGLALGFWFGSRGAQLVQQRLRVSP